MTIDPSVAITVAIALAIWACVREWRSSRRAPIVTVTAHGGGGGGGGAASARPSEGVRVSFGDPGASGGIVTRTVTEAGAGDDLSGGGSSAS